jgi:proteasome accessory factor B
MSELSLSPVPSAQSESELPLTTSKKGRRTRRFGVEQHSRPPLARMLRIHDLISRNSHPNCTSMAAEFEVSCKTVMRDIDFMRDQMQLPIAYNALNRGFCYTKPVSAFPSMTMTEGEIVALLVAQKSLEQYKGTAFEKPLKSAFQKMTSNLEEEGFFSFQDLIAAISFRPVGYAIQELRVFDILSQAVLEQRTVEFDYFKLTGKKAERRRVEPYHLGCIDNQWYLIGNDLVRAGIRTFALTRLSNPKLLKFTFQRPQNFSIGDMMASSFSAFETPKPTRVVVRLDAFAARLASERVWHKSQKIKPVPGGGAELTLEVGLAPDLENWILGWGTHAKVLEPHELCERIASIARSMALQYSV